jgi:hypothetical protein
MKRAVMVGLILCGPVLAQDKPDTKSTTAEAAIASGPVTVCSPNEAGSDCDKRDLARMFLIAGKPEAALRVLCSTFAARTAFGDDTHGGVPSRCLQSVGVEPKQAQK